MTWLASIQQVHDDGSLGPLPGEPDVIQVTHDDVFELATIVAEELARFPDVRDFDLTITNRAHAPARAAADVLGPPPEQLADAWRRYQAGEHVEPYELRKLDEWRAERAEQEGY
jgi:hypothetical protein